MKGRKTRTQSAMEYLMTYGWAILIIAVILGVLFSLGVFNPVNYAPKVPAGNCHVFRPNGPGTSFNVNLVGTCSGFLPQYVAHFNGQSSYINVTSTTSTQFGSPITVAMWVYYGNVQTQYPMLVARGTHSPGYFELVASSSLNTVELGITNTGGTEYYSTGLPLGRGSWHFVAATAAANGNMTLYVDGTSRSVTNSGAILGTGTGNLSIGKYSDFDFLNGSIANFQLYNASLDANEISYLYNEGIGGAPVYLSHLAGWWPLNGDTKDYSGNGNDGTPANIDFNGSWSSGYTAP